ncbi:hypothetical protein [Streptomyces bauhiniae]|uniref:hypothetical protein n=1 Tax=Streptomyces bauhiniae TaxID=2340725 RepID=UPI0035E1F1F4
MADPVRRRLLTPMPVRSLTPPRRCDVAGELAWGLYTTAEHTPAEAGIGFAVRMS